MAKTTVPKAILELAQQVTGKRPRAVIDHIIKHGSVTTEELNEIYEYNHPPRAARDVRECGIPLVTTRVVGKSGRKIGAYAFGDPAKVERHKLAGRSVLSRALKLKLLGRQGSRCNITGEPFEPLYLSIDHRIPYEVAGDRVSTEEDVDAFMLISAAAQRQKSWACEHCINWRKKKQPDICRRCYWASPERYDHVACEPRRRVDLVWTGDDVTIYERAAQQAGRLNMPVGQYLRELLNRLIGEQE